MEHVGDVKRIKGRGCGERLKTSRAIRDVENPVAESIISSILCNARDSKVVAKAEMRNRIHLFKEDLEKRCILLFSRKSTLE